MEMEKTKYYSWTILDSKYGWTCYNILSYNSDGSFDDYEDIVWLRDRETTIQDYITQNGGAILPE